MCLQKMALVWQWRLLEDSTTSLRWKVSRYLSTPQLFSITSWTLSIFLLVVKLSFLQMNVAVDKGNVYFLQVFSFTHTAKRQNPVLFLNLIAAFPPGRSEHWHCLLGSLCPRHGPDVLWQGLRLDTDAQMLHFPAPHFVAYKEEKSFHATLPHQIMLSVSLFFLQSSIFSSSCLDKNAHNGRK